MLSRVADSLYWMSRYIERAENNARIAEVNLQLLARSRESAAIGCAAAMEPDHQLARGKRTVCLALRHSSMAMAAIDFVGLQEENPNSISSCLTLARENARSTREQMSSEMWEQINRLYLFVHSDSGREHSAFESVRIFQAHRRRLASFPRHHRCDDDARRRLGFHSHRQISRARRLQLAHPRCEISHPSAIGRTASAVTSTPFNGWRC